MTPPRDDDQSLIGDCPGYGYHTGFPGHPRVGDSPRDGDHYLRDSFYSKLQGWYFLPTITQQDRIGHFIYCEDISITKFSDDEILLSFFC